MENFHTLEIHDLSRMAESERVALSTKLIEVLNSGSYVLGKWVSEFEEQFRQYFNFENVVSCANGTEALELCFSLLSQTSNRKKVLLAANAGMYAALSIGKYGLTPRYVDVDYKTAQINPKEVVQEIDETVLAVVFTHLYGFGQDLSDLRTVCDEYGVALIEDCAQSAGKVDDGLPTGSFGHFSTFSFYPTKNLAAIGDGGAVVVQDYGHAEIVRSLRQYGWSEKYVAERAGGLNSRLDAIQAAVLSLRLNHLSAKIKRQRENLETLHAATEDRGVIEFVAQEFGVLRHTAHLAVAKVKNRNEIISKASNFGLNLGIHYPIPDHKQKALIGKFEIATGLSNTEKLAKEVVTFPCHAMLSSDEVARISSFIRELNHE